MKKIISLVMALCMTLSLAVMGIPLHAAEEGNIIINGVDIGYAAGDYFSTTGEECSCHGRKSCGEASDCTCIVISGCCQCYGFALWCEQKLTNGYNDVKNPGMFHVVDGIAAGELTTDNLKSFIQSLPVGTHIRTNSVKDLYSSHSMIIQKVTDDGFTVVQANGSNNNEYSEYAKCRIGTATYTWEEYLNSSYGKRGFEFAKYYLNWHEDYNPNRNSAITPELIETFLSAYPNGSLTKTATVNGQTVIHTLDTDYDLGFDNYYNYSNNLTQATPLSDKSTAQLLTPAEILYYACVENDMNVVWMLANIQKEQSLVSETHNAEPTYDVRLAHAVGYKKNWSEGEKNCGYIGQVISATYQFKLFANDGKNMEEAYNSYTDPNDTSNMRFDKFKPDIYDVYAAKFDALLGTTPPVVEEEYLAYPTITAPAADGTYTAGSAITFSWNAVEGATSYEYGIRDLTDDVTLNGADNTTTQTSVTLDGSLVKAGHEIKFAVGALGDEDMTSPGWSSVTVTIADSGDTPTPGTIIAEGTCGDNLTWTLDDAGTLTISGEGNMYNYNPAPWDAYKDTITSLVLPNGLNYIGHYAFKDCSGLISVSIPNGITGIGEYTFSGCSSLTIVSIPDSVKWISNSAFSNCSSLTYVSIPDSVTSIGSCAFERCSKLMSASIPDGITTIASSVFFDCSNLISIYIPDSIKSIGATAFSGCSSLTSVSIPSGVTSIEVSAFSNCSSLTAISIPVGVTSIEGYTFSGCSSLTSVSIPNGVTSIGECAFSGCSSLTSVSIPDGVISIGELTFFGCSSLTSVSIPNGVSVIERYTFYNCPRLTSISIPNSVTNIGEYAFTYCTGLITVSIPNSVTNIEYAAFYKCSSLTAVAIPNSVTSIGEYAFSDCSSLTAISIPDSITSIERDSFSGCTGLTTVSIPNSVTRIGDYAFNNCTSLPAISIPDSVTSIGVQAFRTCLSLTAITIPDSVTSIGDYIFYSCPNLTTVSIPAGITSINGAFYNCTSLTSVYFHGDAPTLNTNAFLNTPSSLVLYYIAGKSGWTSPTWTDSNGVTYNTATFTPGAVDPNPTIPGDISGDGVLDYFDVTALYAAYQSGEVDTEVMDVNHDGVVDYYDVSKLYAAFRGTATLT